MKYLKYSFFLTALYLQTSFCSEQDLLKANEHKKSLEMTEINTFTTKTTENDNNLEKQSAYSGFFEFKNSLEGVTFEVVDTKINNGEINGTIDIKNPIKFYYENPKKFVSTEQEEHVLNERWDKIDSSLFNYIKLKFKFDEEIFGENFAEEADFCWGLISNQTLYYFLKSECLKVQGLYKNRRVLKGTINENDTYGQNVTFYFDCKL